jgi:hypothetical protein
MHVSDSDAVDAFDEVEAAALDNGMSWMATASVNGTAVPVVAVGEDGADWLDTDEEAYVSVNDAGDEVVLENAGEVLDEDQSVASVKLMGPESAGFTHARSLAADYGAGTLESLGAGAAAGIDFNGNPDFAEA